MDLSMGARIEYVDLDAVAAWPRNPKRHDLPMLGASFDRSRAASSASSGRRQGSRRRYRSSSSTT